jgi:hypothetical protein
MKSLDKPTIRRSDNLPYIKKNKAVPFKILVEGKLHESLHRKTTFLWLNVSGWNSQQNGGKN